MPLLTKNKQSPKTSNEQLRLFTTTYLSNKLAVHMHFAPRMKPRFIGQERRRFERLPLAIPVFVRGMDMDGKPFIEFATAVDISAGGTLLAVQHYLPMGAKLVLEIPSAPIPDLSIPHSNNKNLTGKLVRMIHGDRWHLIGIRFSRPLLKIHPKRKVPSVV